MKHATCKPFVPMLAAFALVLAASGAVAAQDTTPTGMDKAAMHSDQADSMRMQGMKGMMHHNMMGAHAMPATVTAVDAKTGIVDVDSEGMALKVHFPPSAVAGLKSGDKITLHFAYSKP